MPALLSFLLRATAVSGCLYLYYVLFLRRKKMPGYNRFYLLGTVAASLILPLVHFGRYHIKPPAGQAGKIVQLISRPVVAPNTVPAGSNHAGSLAVIIYIAIGLFLLLGLLLKVRAIFRLKSTGAQVTYAGANLVKTDNSSAPFSFLDTIFWRKDLPLDSDEGQLIFLHELCHVQQRHSLDVLLMQLALAVAWVNPFFWLIRKELSLQHEFQADEAAVGSGDTESFAAMILCLHKINRLHSVAQPFFSSAIEKRLYMAGSSSIGNGAWARKLSVAALLAAMVFTLSLKLEEQPFLTVPSAPATATAATPATTAEAPADTAEAPGDAAPAPATGSARQVVPATSRRKDPVKDASRLTAPEQQVVDDEEWKQYEAAKNARERTANIRPSTRYSAPTATTGQDAANNPQRMTDAERKIVEEINREADEKRRNDPFER